METAYAQALWKVIKTGTSPEKAIGAMRESLTHHGRENLMPRIARAFDRVAKRDIARNEISLTIAHENDLELAKKQAAEFLAKANLADASIKACVDDTLIGGWRLEGKEHLVDMSYKKQLLSIYNAATRA